MTHRKALAIAGLLTLAALSVLWLQPIAAQVTPTWWVTKAVNGMWPTTQCGSGSTPTACTEQWILGAGTADPPSGYGSTGDLFWRTDTQTWRTKVSGAWAEARVNTAMDRDFPTIKSQTFSITQAQLLNLFSSPVTLIAATASTAHIPVGGFIYRESGNAYTCPADVGIFGQGTAQPYITSISTILTVAGPGIQPAWSVGNMTSGSFSTIATKALPSNSAAINDPIQLATTVGNPTGGTGGLTIVLYYRDWQLVPLASQP